MDIHSFNSLQHIFISSAYMYHLISDIKRDYTNNKYGLIPLGYDLVKKYKKSDTLFILGSGSTINKISDKQWGKIDDHDSIGFNFWLVHDFVPDFFKFELDLSGESNRTDLFLKILDEKWQKYKKKLIIYNHHNSTEKVPDIVLSKLVKKNIYYPNYINLPGKNIDSLKKSIKYFKIIEKYFFNNSVLFSKRSSLIMIISMALLFGYKKIVLCGVDLNNTKYFYEDEYYLNKYPNLNSGQPGSVHMSFDENLNPLTIDKIILSINRMMIQNVEKKLFVFNKSSALYPELPIFN